MTALREIEADSIRTFVLDAASDGFLDGRVLDYGCGKQPYREIVETAGGVYQGYDSPAFPGSVAAEEIGFSEWWDTQGEPAFDTILCTQVLQYVAHPEYVLAEFAFMLGRPGRVVLTYPTNWPEVEPEDLHRFTRAGIEALLESAGFTIIRHETRAEVWIHGERFALGGGVVARA